MSYWKHGTLRYLLALVLVLAITASQIVPSYAETNPVSGGDSTISSSAEEDGTPETTETQSTDGGEDSTEETGESLPAESSEANPEETMESLTAESEEAGSEGTTEPQAAESNEAGTEETGTEAADQETDPGTDVSSGDVSSGDMKSESMVETTIINGVGATVTVTTEDPSLAGTELKIEDGQPNQVILDAYLGNKAPYAEKKREISFGLSLWKNEKKVEPAKNYSLDVTIKFESPITFGEDDDIVELIHYTEKNGTQIGMESLQVLYSNADAVDGTPANGFTLDELSFTVDSFSTFSLVAAEVVKRDLLEGNGWLYNPNTKKLTITGDYGISHYSNADGWYYQLVTHPEKAGLAKVTELNEVEINGNLGDIIGANSGSWQTFFKYLPATVSLVMDNIPMGSIAAKDLSSQLKTPLKSLTLRNISLISNGLFSKYAFAEGAVLTIENCGELKNQGTEKDPKGVFQSVTGLDKVILRNVQNIGNATFQNASIKNLEIYNCGLIGKVAFRNNDRLETLILSNDGAGPYSMDVGNEAFADCDSLQRIDLNLKGCTALRAMTFENSGADGVVVTGLDTGNEETDLGYTNLYQKLTEEQKTWLLNRMKNIMNGKFTIDEGTTESDKLSLDPEKDAKWMSYEKGNESSYKYGYSNQTDETQIIKSARWLDDTTAEVQFRFNYAMSQGKDFLFVIDMSDSITNVAEGYQDSMFYNIQSKTLDTALKLVQTEGYSNRVGIVAFSSNDVEVSQQDFTDNANTLSAFLLGLVPPNAAATHYDYALEAAETMINERSDKTRDVELIFISDGAPQTGRDGKDVAKRLKKAPAGKQDPVTTIYTIFQGTKTPNQTAETKLKSLASTIKIENNETMSLYFNAYDSEGFSSAVNKAIQMAFATKLVRDVVGEDFEIVDLNQDGVIDEKDITITEDCGSVAYDAEKKELTWTVSGLPFTTYYMTYQVRLKKDAAGNYPEQYELKTNEGEAIVYDGWLKTDKNGDLTNKEINKVASPALPRYTKLLLTKTLEDYSSDLDGATFVFKVTGTKNDGSEKVFERLVGMTFDSAGTQSELLEFVPPCDEITVEEIYSGSYELVDDENVISYSASEEKTYADGETVKLYDSYYGMLAENGTEESDDTFNYSASYTNHYNGSLNGGSGVINVYTAPNGEYYAEQKSKDDQAD